MKYFIDGRERKIYFTKDNTAFYKSKGNQVDVTYMFKKTKKGLELRKKYLKTGGAGEEDIIKKEIIKYFEEFKKDINTESAVYNKVLSRKHNDYLTEFMQEVRYTKPTEEDNTQIKIITTYVHDIAFPFFILKVRDILKKIRELEVQGITYSYVNFANNDNEFTLNADLHTQNDKKILKIYYKKKKELDFSTDHFVYFTLLFAPLISLDVDRDPETAIRFRAVSNTYLKLDMINRLIEEAKYPVDLDDVRIEIPGGYKKTTNKNR
jgi:hypothetical protein